MADDQKRDESLSKTVKPYTSKLIYNKTDIYYSSPVERLSNFIDSHLLEARLFTVGLVGVGLVIIARSIRIGTRFSSVEEIPERFIARHIRLRGVVKTIDSIGPIVYIDHIPIAKFSSFKADTDGLLPVSLYGVITEPLGVDWLKTNCMNQEVWFQLISTNDKNHLDCMIKLRKNWMRTIRVNEFLVKNGLARVQQIEDSSLDSTRVRFLNAIVKAEAEAQRKKRGIWKESKRSEYSSSVSKPFNFIKHFGNRLLTKCKNTLSYYFKHK